jgi:hypothetical protein
MLSISSAMKQTLPARCESAAGVMGPKPSALITAYTNPLETHRHLFCRGWRRLLCRQQYHVSVGGSGGCGQLRQLWPTAQADANQCHTGVVRRDPDFVAIHTGSIGRINTLLPLFQHVKKENNCVFRLQNLTDIRRHPLICSLQTTDPVNFQPPGVPAPWRYLDSQQFGELTESNCSQRLSKQICLGRRPALG